MYDMYDIILLEPYNGGNIGDIVTVPRGIYNTMINMKKGLPLNCYEDDLTDTQRLVINAKRLEEENEELMDANAELYKEIQELKKIIED